MGLTNEHVHRTKNISKNQNLCPHQNYFLRFAMRYPVYNQKDVYPSLAESKQGYMLIVKDG